MLDYQNRRYSLPLVYESSNGGYPPGGAIHGRLRPGGRPRLRANGSSRPFPGLSTYRQNRCSFGKRCFEARRAAFTDHGIEYGGKPVLSVSGHSGRRWCARASAPTCRTVRNLLRHTPRCTWRNMACRWMKSAKFSAIRIRRSPIGCMRCFRRVT